MKRLMMVAAGAAFLGGCDIPPYQTPVASDSMAGVAHWRCDQLAIAVVSEENDLFRQIFEREQLRRRCLAGENISLQDEPAAPMTGPAAAPTPESGPRPAGAIPPPPVVPRN